MTMPTMAALHVPTAAEFEQITDQVDSNRAATWTNYTPTWTASVNPAIGNGAIAGRYRRPTNSDLVHFTVRILMGGTTTYGTGVWSVGLPASPAPSATALTHLVASGTAYDSSSGVTVPLSTRTASGAMIIGTASGPGSVATSTVPFTWASGDILTLNGFYEPA